MDTAEIQGKELKQEMEGQNMHENITLQVIYLCHVEPLLHRFGRPYNGTSLARGEA